MVTKSTKTHYIYDQSDHRVAQRVRSKRQDERNSTSSQRRRQTSFALPCGPEWPWWVTPLSLSKPASLATRPPSHLPQPRRCAVGVLFCPPLQLLQSLYTLGNVGWPPLWYEGRRGHGRRSWLEKVSRWTIRAARAS